METVDRVSAFIWGLFDKYLVHMMHRRASGGARSRWHSVSVGGAMFVQQAEITTSFITMKRKSSSFHPETGASVLGVRLFSSFANCW
ncbi:hypothetical protein EYF80_048786 [Liparis tanakae]|uniref:Uncharacterized protein n=1 Tax=Liparis tanakae TaxID=230148 RepID=A0A4Z2FIR0_9TELE|nr:hypothetical protein EYF80_048786 [Liparis tanakae]